MNDRRRGERNILSQPGMGTVRVTQDVEVTRLDGTEAAVITTQTLPVGERVLLEIPDERSAISKARLFRTVKTRFVFKDGRLRREVQLSIIGHTGLPEARGTTEPIRPMTAPMIAAISRRVPVRLVEVSTSGCLCDAPTPLEEGSVGFGRSQDSRPASDRSGPDPADAPRGGIELALPNGRRVPHARATLA
jgi:hypothetical protein